MTQTHPALIFSPEVAMARAEGRAIVALESTIITHGMPYPQNVATARKVEDAIRARHATPATIAILDGAIRIGLDDALLDRLAQTTNVMKLSRADLGFAVATGRPGSTTVAATMICAQLAGIDVFATGGIGGVHRDILQSMDISADLDEFVQTDVTVVCAGAKALLDLPRTLEYLETRGVPVIGYRTDAFPAFWSRESGLAAPLRLDTAQEIARAVQVRRSLGLQGGTIVANPVPHEDEIPFKTMACMIDAALAAAQSDGIRGKWVTPYLLGKIFELTAGRSLDTNIALVLNNARLAADIAMAFSTAKI